ncbi:hypothetical protein ACSQ67_006370 [Phaseolus vulgaris]
MGFLQMICSNESMKKNPWRKAFPGSGPLLVLCRITFHTDTCSHTLLLLFTRSLLHLNPTRANLDLPFIASLRAIDSHKPISSLFFCTCPFLSASCSSV